MKQIQLVYGYDNEAEFRGRLREIREKYPDCVAVFNVFYDKERAEEIRRLRELLRADYPEAHYLGCASNANIHNGVLEEGTIEAICTVYEDKTTQIKIKQYELSESNIEHICDDMLKVVEENPWVKGIELLMTIRGMSTTYFCDKLSQMRDDIEIFGGSSFNKNFDLRDTEVFSEDGDFIESGVVFALIGSDSLKISSTFISGWKTLGQTFKITKADKNRLYELDGLPAYELYYRYLRIENDEHFYHNALEFPIFYKRNNINILRVPQGSLEDGSLIMTSDMQEGSTAQLSYGDPQTILRSLFDEAKKLSEFSPEAIMIFDCGSRRGFWGKEDINRESLPFQSLADTSGFYTSGEFHREGSSLNQHNVTLVIVGMREGEPKDGENPELKRYDYENSHVSMVRRLANFIDVASKELEAANIKLGKANERLSNMAITDELTGLLNRRAVKSYINTEFESGRRFSLVMLDLDYFKNVNDTYGHDEGDRVLVRFARVIKQCSDMSGALVQSGRWGGEEFMILVPDPDIEVAKKLAEDIRCTFGEIDFAESGKHTVSCGVTLLGDSDDADGIITRVDGALYQAKRTGRNKTCTL